MRQKLRPKYNLFRMIFMDRIITRDDLLKVSDSQSQASQLLYGKRAPGDETIRKLCILKNLSEDEFYLDITPSMEFTLERLKDEARNKKGQDSEIIDAIDTHGET